MDAHAKQMPSVCAEFYLTGYDNNVDLDVITRLLDIIPTKTRKQEEFPLVSQNMKLAHDIWSLSMPSAICYNIDEQLRLLVDILYNKREIIKYLQKKLSIKAAFCLFIHTNEKKGYPKMLFSKSFIELASYIEASIDIDDYRY